VSLNSAYPPDLHNRRHRAVEPLLAPWNLGFSDAEAEHCLIIDRTAGHASVAPIAVAQEFLRSQHPPPPELTPEQREALQRRLEEIIAQRRQQLRVDPQEIARRMKEQQQALSRMVSWLDQCPSPPGPRPGRGR
jgi:hypothetical protein